MLTAQRQQLIREELAHAGRVVANDLAQRFALSADTIRRDLRQMSRAGECQRVYGGAIAPSAGRLDQRHDHLADEKARLARRAVALLDPGQTVLIDAGSTNTAIARALPADMALNVVTNAPDIAALIALRDDVNLVALGGSFDRQTGACVGPQTLAALAAVRADWLFLGSCGFDARAGVTAQDASEAAVKTAMVDVSDRVAVAVTGEKRGTAAPFRVMPLKDLTVVITDDGVMPEPVTSVA